MNWDQICDDPHLRDLPYKIEQDRYGKILLCPSTSDHGEYQAKIVALLDRLLPEWSIIVECAIDTTEGTKVADVAAMPRIRRLPHRGVASLPIAPEICVEVISWSNSVAELDEKRRLYAVKGCQEFWTSSEAGDIEFREALSGKKLERSLLCPEFPIKVVL